MLPGLFLPVLPLCSGPNVILVRWELKAGTARGLGCRGEKSHRGACRGALREWRSRQPAGFTSMWLFLHSAPNAKRCIAEQMTRRAEAGVEIGTLETNRHGWQADPVVHLQGDTAPPCAAVVLCFPALPQWPIGGGGTGRCSITKCDARVTCPPPRALMHLRWCGCNRCTAGYKGVYEPVISRGMPVGAAAPLLVLAVAETEHRECSTASEGPDSTAGGRTEVRPRRDMSSS